MGESTIKDIRTLNRAIKSHTHTEQSLEQLDKKARQRLLDDIDALSENILIEDRPRYYRDIWLSMTQEGKKKKSAKKFFLF